MSSQLHAPATLPLIYSHEQEAGWTPALVKKPWRVEKSLEHAGNRFTAPQHPSRRPVIILTELSRLAKCTKAYLHFIAKLRFWRFLMQTQTDDEVCQAPLRLAL
jgi:hypothetical protein